MNEYPAMLRLKGKKVTVIGGGSVAERKIGSLLESEGTVTVVSPAITEQIKQWAKTSQLVWKKKEFEPVDVDGSFLVIAATNKSEVNQQVVEAVHETQLINVVDDPEKSNFIVPSSMKQGKLTIAISTSGSSPTLARKIKQELASQYDKSFASYLDFLQNCRTVVKEEVRDPVVRKKLLQELLQEDFLELTRSGRFEERNKRFIQLLKDKFD